MNMLNPPILVCIVLTSLPAQAIDGWDLSFNHNALVYTPNNLATGKIFEYAVFGPFELNGVVLKEWFTKKSRSMQNNLGEPLKKWRVNREKADWSVSNSFIDQQGVRMSVGYQGGALKNGDAYIIRLLANEEFVLLLSYGAQFNSVLNDAKKILNKNSSLSVVEKAQTDNGKRDKPKKGREEIEAAVRTKPGKGVNLSDIEVVWVDSNRELIWGGVDVDTYLLFKDGSAYRNCVIPPNELNIKRSKELEPEKWTDWRKEGNGYQIKVREIKGWKSLSGRPGVAARSGEWISGKFINTGGSQFVEAWKKIIIFYADGRFETASPSPHSNSESGEGETTPLMTVLSASDEQGAPETASVTGQNQGCGVSSIREGGVKNRGSYRLGEYAITLRHDNGWEHTELFYFEENNGKRNIVYGNDLYWPDD